MKSRREFLGRIGGTLGGAAVGWAFAGRLGWAQEAAEAARARLRFGALDPLVDLLQATPPDALLSLVVERLRAGTPLADVVGAAALANARGFGGTHYNGYHALMALVPSYEMAARMPAPYGPLPALKVLHRNARFLQEAGRAQEDALAPLPDEAGEAALAEPVRARDLPRAERGAAALAQRSQPQAFEELQTVVRDDMNVHRVVLAWRAYDLLRLTGDEQAAAMLRQCVRFCIDEDQGRASRGVEPSPIRALLPKLMEEHGLDGRERARRAADDAWIERLSDAFFGPDRAAAAGAAAAALAEGFDPEDVGAALSLAAVRLLLFDRGQSAAAPGRPEGSVHGASVGVHASDAANAWRRLARTGGAPNACASLIAGAYHTAGQSREVGPANFDAGGEPLALADPAELRAALDASIRERDQAGACRAARRYVELGHPDGELFALLAGHAVSEDGALHAEKYFRTVEEEHAAARPAHRGRFLVALARVMASHHGFPAPGCDEARRLLAS